MTLKRSSAPRPIRRSNPATSAIATAEAERASQLADITATGDDDNAECAAADHFREFLPCP